VFAGLVAADTGRCSDRGDQVVEEVLKVRTAQSTIGSIARDIGKIKCPRRPRGDARQVCCPDLGIASVPVGGGHHAALPM